MVGGRYGLAGNGQKIKKNLVSHGGLCRRFAGPIRARPTAARREISPEWSSGGDAPPRPAHVHCGWPESRPLVQNSSARKWSKMILWGVHDLESSS